MKYKINYAIGGGPLWSRNQPPPPTQPPFDIIPQDVMNITLQNLTNEEIIKRCSLNKRDCQKVSWSKLIRDRNINIESVLNLDEPTMCEHISDIQRPYCRKFYNYTKYYKYTKHFKTIAAGRYHLMALQNDGTVVVWNYLGLINANNTPSHELNVPVGLNNVVSIAVGHSHSMALKNDGTVVAWGRKKHGQNKHGQLNVPAGLNNVVSIAANGYHSMALQNDGTVVVWGALQRQYLGSAYGPTLEPGERNVPNGLNNVVSIAAGYYHSMALKNDGTVVVWGNDRFGNRNNKPDDLNNVVSIAAGHFHSMALQNDGTVRVWDEDDRDDEEDQPDLIDVVSIAASIRHSMALQNNGTVIAWGTEQHIVPPDLNNVVSITSGDSHSMALKNNGTVVVWGHSFYYTPPGLIARVP